ncbi:hypothetical protein WBG78_05945 [Chryseolinea sp. T2]|uniref:hypothetical protein n=1 Tax=Chryseolinea sp. T2 TaxID=3129255 RepID=UPI003076E062
MITFGNANFKYRSDSYVRQPKKEFAFIVVFVLISALQAMGQAVPDSWALFAKTKFEPKYHEKAQEYLMHPNFPPEIKAMEGKEISVVGYFLPFAPEGSGYIIISKYPMSQCYFCGGGGPESIAEVNFAKSQAKFQMDDLITVKGKLKLNADDMDHINFIVVDAELIKR